MHKPVNSESETALKHYQIPAPTEGSGAYLCVRLHYIFHVETFSGAHKIDGIVLKSVIQESRIVNMQV